MYRQQWECLQRNVKQRNAFCIVPWPSTPMWCSLSLRFQFSMSDLPRRLQKWPSHAPKLYLRRPETRKRERVSRGHKYLLTHTKRTRMGMLTHGHAHAQACAQSYKTPWNIHPSDLFKSAPSPSPAWQYTESCLKEIIKLSRKILRGKYILNSQNKLSAISQHRDNFQHNILRIS